MCNKVLMYMYNNTIILHVFKCYTNIQTLSLTHVHTHTHTHFTARLITQPPVSTTSALGTNSTFSCHGTGSVLWQINDIQVRDAK